MVWMVGSEEMLGRRARAVHHFRRRRRPGGERTTAWWGDQVRVAVHLSHQMLELRTVWIHPVKVLVESKVCERFPRWLEAMNVYGIDSNGRVMTDW